MVLCKIKTNSKKRDRRNLHRQKKHLKAATLGPKKTFRVSPKTSYHPVLQEMFQLLELGGLPYVLLSLFDLVFDSMTQPTAALTSMEAFAGVKSITNAFRSLGQPAASYEVLDRPVYEDIMGGVGYAYLLGLVARLWKSVGCGWFAPVCSSWVWINRATSGRSREAPLGDRSKEFVRVANGMIYRVTAALIMMSTLNIPWFVEQPGSSLMEHHPAFQHLCKRFTVYKVFIWLGAYGGDCPKPTLIYSNFKFIEKLFLPLPADKVWEAETSIKYVDSSGQHRVSGGRDLKSTQAYPRLFGHAVAQLFLSERDAVRQAIAERKKELANSKRSIKPLKDIGWANGADLQQVIKALRG